MKTLRTNMKSPFEEMLDKARKHPTYYEESLKLEISDEILRIMDRQGISKAELAERLGTSRSYITKILGGYQNLSLESLARIAFALGYQWEISLVPLEQSAPVLKKKMSM